MQLILMSLEHNDSLAAIISPFLAACSSVNSFAATAAAFYIYMNIGEKKFM